MAISTIGATDNGFYLPLVVLCLVMLSVSMLRRSQHRSATTRDLTREQLARLRDQKDVRQSMDDLLTQLEEVSRRVNAQVETRFVKLETVIRDADDRIARLELLAPSAKAPQHVSGITSPAANDTESATKGSSDFQPGIAGVVSRATSSLPPSAANPVAESAAVPPASQPMSREERRRRIYELADAGTTPMTIADTLQVPLGEVELILSLRDFK